jgi:hypothetical protein
LEIHKHYKKGTILLALLLTGLFLTLQVNLPNTNLAASGDTGTQVGGTITSNTTWTAANSPYTLTNTIQIPENVNLTIEPGVTVTVQPSVSTMFLINGAITAHGDPTNKIIFDGGGNSNFFKTNHPVAKGFVDLDYCIVRNGGSAFWFDNTGSFNVTNSELSYLSEESYLWYPSQDTFIEYNTFTNTSGIKIGTDDYSSNSSGNVYIKYNLFLNNQGYIIDNFASYGLSKTYVNNNSFTGTSGIILEVEKTSTTADMDASQNYWGTTNTSTIDSMIYDKNDDPSCFSFINYLPLLDVPDPDAPVAPTPTPSPSTPPTPTDTPAPTPTQSPVPGTSNTPSPTPVPSVSPDPTSAPTQSPSPTTNPTSTQPPDNSAVSDPTSNPANPSANPTVNPSTNFLRTNPSTAPTVPEFSSLVALLILLIESSTAAMVLRRKKS